MDTTTKWKVTGVTYIGRHNDGSSAWIVCWERTFETGRHPTTIKEREYFSADDALGALVKFRKEITRHHPLENEIIGGGDGTD